MPAISRGASAGGLVRYLAGDGRGHELQRVIDGSLGQVGDLTDRVFRASVIADLNAPSVGHPNVRTMHRTKTEARHGDDATHRPIWHCSLSLKAGDAAVSDAQWSTISKDFMQGMGFPADTRWVVVGHGKSTAGNEHVHIAANLVTEGGARVNTMYDFSRAQRQCTRLEQKYGLSVLASRVDGVSVPGLSPVECDQQRQGRVPDRVKLRDVIRVAQGGARTEGAFIQNVRATGSQLRVVAREGRVVGFAVAMPGSNMWFAGSALGHDLTIESLRRDWTGPEQSKQQWQQTGDPARKVGGAPTPATYKQATGELQRLAVKLPSLGVRGRADAAHQISGALAANGLLGEAREAAGMAGARHRPGQVKRVTLTAGVLAMSLMDQDSSPAQQVVIRQLMRTFVALQATRHTSGGDHRVGGTVMSEQQVRESVRQRVGREARERIAARVERAASRPDRTMWDASTIRAYQAEAAITRRHPDAFGEAVVQKVTAAQSERIVALSGELYGPGSQAMTPEYISGLDRSDAVMLERQLEFGLGEDRVGRVDAQLATDFMASHEVLLPPVLVDLSGIPVPVERLPDRLQVVGLKPAGEWKTGAEDMRPAQRGKLLGAGYKPNEIDGLTKANASLLIDGKLTPGQAQQASRVARDQVAPREVVVSGPVQQGPPKQVPAAEQSQRQGRSA